MRPAPQPYRAEQPAPAPKVRSYPNRAARRAGEREERQLRAELARTRAQLAQLRAEQ